LLDQTGVTGLKTGITNSAGPCLSTAITLENGIQTIIVLLNCKNPDCRWAETMKLAKWTRKRMGKIEKFKNEIKQSG